MRKRLAAIAVGTMLAGALSVSPAPAAELPCIPGVPDATGCWVRCNLYWAQDFIRNLPSVTNNGCQST